ncbi:MAG: hypothetical protein J6Y80_03355 [Victivallales bacterium]|nr:hypothetical protein [Victivallales bacterium]
MNFTPASDSLRRFTPRIVIYTVLILIAAWWMTKLDKTRQNQTLPTSQPPGSAELLAATAVGADSELPLMVVIAVADESVREIVAEAQRRHEGRCRIVLLSTGTDTAGVQKVFQVEDLPAVLLYNKDNKEIARQTGPVSAESLDTLLAAPADQ